MEGGKANRRKGKPGQINKKSTKKGSKKKKNKNTKRNYDSKKTTKKGKKPTRRKQTKIELFRRKNDRQTSCDAFTTIDTMKDYKYVRNQVQKAKRVQSTISQLERKTAKASTVFQNATAFFKKCPEGMDLYEQLRYQILYLYLKIDLSS